MATTRKGPQRPKAATVAKSIATRPSLPAVVKAGVVTSWIKLLVTSKVGTPEIRESNNSVKPRMVANPSMIIGRSRTVWTTIVRPMNSDHLEMFDIVLTTGVYHKVRPRVNHCVSVLNVQC